MTVTDQIALVVTWLNALEIMSDEDFVTNNYWTTTVIGSTGGIYINNFTEEIGIEEVDKNTAIAILKNFYLTLMVEGFSHS